MAKNRNMTEEKLRKAKADNAVVYKVMIALALACAALFSLRSLRAYYATVGGFSALYDKTPWIMAGGLALAVLSGVLLKVWKKPAVRAVFPWLLTAGVLAAVVGYTMRLSWVDDFPLLYFLFVAVLVQYVIFLLYRWEFFLVSLSTMAAGGLYFGYSSGFAMNPKSIWLFVILMLALAGTALCGFLASRRKGRLVLGRLRYTMFPVKFTPVLIYLVDILWLCCTAAVLLLGSLFAYYCMFAAIAVEFIAAVYYTFQLN